MKYRAILFYLVQVTNEFICYLFHELTHFIFAWFFRICGIIDSNPKLEVLKYPHIELDKSELNRCIITSTRMQITYFTYDWKSERSCEISNGIIASSPLFGLLFLILISPWWMNIYYLVNIETLFISLGDYRQIKQIFFPQKPSPNFTTLKPIPS